MRVCDRCKAPAAHRLWLDGPTGAELDACAPCAAKIAAAIRTVIDTPDQKTWQQMLADLDTGAAARRYVDSSTDTAA